MAGLAAPPSSQLSMFATSLWCSALWSAQQSGNPHCEQAPRISLMSCQSQPPFVINPSPSCSSCLLPLPWSPRPFASSPVGLLGSFSWSAPPSSPSTLFASSVLCSITCPCWAESTGDGPSSWFRFPQLCVVPSPSFVLLALTGLTEYQQRIGRGVLLAALWNITDWTS